MISILNVFSVLFFFFSHNNSDIQYLSSFFSSITFSLKIFLKGYCVMEGGYFLNICKLLWLILLLLEGATVSFSLIFHYVFTIVLSFPTNISLVRNSVEYLNFECFHIFAVFKILSYKFLGQI